MQVTTLTSKSCHILVVLHVQGHQGPLDQGHQARCQLLPLRQDHAHLGPMPLEEILERQLPPPECLPVHLGMLEVQPGIWGHSGGGCQSRPWRRSGKVCHELLEPQGDQPMKDKGIMGSKGVSPHLGAQDIQECLAGNCFADELTHFHFHMLTKMHVPNTNHTHMHTQQIHQPA